MLENWVTLLWVVILVVCFQKKMYEKTLICLQVLLWILSQTQTFFVLIKNCGHFKTIFSFLYLIFLSLNKRSSFLTLLSTFAHKQHCFLRVSSLSLSTYTHTHLYSMPATKILHLHSIIVSSVSVLLFYFHP